MQILLYTETSMKVISEHTGFGAERGRTVNTLMLTESSVTDRGISNRNIERICISFFNNSISFRDFRRS